MKKKNPGSIPVTTSWSDIMTRIIPGVLEELNGNPLPSPDKFRGIIDTEFMKMFFNTSIADTTVKFPQFPLAERISGPMGNVSYADSDKLQPHARRRPSKPPKPTPARLTQQDRMRQANTAWKSLDPSIQTAWDTQAKGKPYTGVNLYKGVYVALLVDNLPIPDPLVPTQALLKWYFSRKASK